MPKSHALSLCNEIKDLQLENAKIIDELEVQRNALQASVNSSGSMRTIAPILLNDVPMFISIGKRNK